MPLFAIGAGLAIGSAVSGIIGSSKQKKQAKKIRREALVQNNLGRERLAIESGIQDTQRVSALRENRLQALQSSREAARRRSTILAAAIGAGVGSGSSGVQGAVGSTQSQLGFNIGRISNIERAAGSIFDRQRQIQGIQAKEVESNQRAARAASKAGQIGANVNLAQGLFSAGSSIFNLFTSPGGASPRGVSSTNS